ncbi:MAG: Glycosyltransferase [uncultured bacterium]|nr:MAG: Glycosyltransferase [uncultured bacterium]KKQ45572.1 MAG: Glycosyltransferase [Candidatus Moranbacteria bacterium GW2011_GWC2_37_8]KKQ62275.1 MAG: Glycosyltransferase [Parcubacteria group bacterium GW2011_GWC1_38_22]KKQ81153.1 MAG: Glycosyltransferase [Candidatus Moranbacteria bacterium GW2011_GWD2_38_7]
MRIAFIGKKIAPANVSGIEKYVEEVSLCMAEKNHDIFIYSLSKDVSEKIKENEKIEIVILPKILEKIGEFSQVLWASMHAIFAKYDVIHYQSKSTFLLSWIPKIFCKEIKIVSSFDLQCDFRSKPGITLFDSKEVAAMSKLNLRKKRFILFAEKFVKEAGAHYLIEAFKQLEDTAKTPNNFKLVIAKIGEQDEDYVKYLHTISEGRSNIIFIDKQADKLLWQLLSSAYMFVQPSYSKNVPAALSKAMLCGLTPLVSDVKENFNITGNDGFSFQSKSVIDLRDKLAYLLSRNDEVEKFGKLAREKMEKEYGWEKIAQKTIEVCKNC